MNYIGVTFVNAIVDISTSIAQIFPLVNVKGHKAIVSQVGTNSDTSYSTHVNDIEFTESNWDKRLSNDDYKCLPKQVRKLIGFVKAHGYHDKQSAFLAEKQQNRIDKKRGVSQVSHSGPSHDDAEKEMVERAVSKIVQHFTKDDASNDNGAPDESPKSNANAGSILVDRTQLEESVYLDEAPEAHPMATNQAFLSKLMQLSHLSDITFSLQLVGQFNQSLAPKDIVKL